MWVRDIRVPNGNLLAKVQIFKCDECGEEMDESFPMHEDGNIHYCMECGFKKGVVSEKNYLRFGSGISLPNCRAGINPETKEIEITIGKNARFSWEKTDKDHRHTPEYKHWRKSVLERDDYTCQTCGGKGGELNAHHIKSYTKYKKLRYEITNGITLCKECHKKEHQKR